ncbi:YybH family protein [Spirosoma pollinicola]|nr:DUF4440 domain-containing protein [Spirosoma pollinicola]
MKLTLLTLVLFALFSAQSLAQSNAAKASVVAANQKFMDIFSKGTTGISDLYATDAELYPPNGDVVKGNTAIGPVWKGAFDAGVKNVNLETVTADPAGDQIIETGRYKLSGADSSAIDSGKYIVIWKKEKGDWKLYRDIWNTSIAAK